MKENQNVKSRAGKKGARTFCPGGANLSLFLFFLDNSRSQAFLLCQLPLRSLHPPAVVAGVGRVLR